MGIWIMFLLLVGVLCGRFYSQDKERGILRRIGFAPVRAGSYLAAHGGFTFLLCFVPALLTVGIEGSILGNGLGLSLPSWALVLACTAALASSFSLFVGTLLPDEDRAVNVASMATLFTTLLSGSFVAPQVQGKVLRAVSTFMPQRAIMEITAGLEGGRVALIAPLSVLLAAVVAFSVVAYLLTASRLRRSRG
jgi:ABC-type multidrug transport system permease subunit